MMKDVVETLQKLPEVCYTYLPSDGRLIAIKRGVMGYWAITSGLSAEELNGPGVTGKHILAMEAGSMFGWEVPGADPDHYTDEEAQTHLDHMRERAKRRAA